MATDQVRARISLSEGAMEFEGPQLFVEAQLAKYDKLIAEAMKSPQHPSSKTKEKQGSSAGSQSHFSDFENVFASADGKVQILKSIPGKSNAQKTVNAALLLAYANKLSGSPSTTYDAVRAMCASHACLDSGNFSKTIREAKENFLLSGSGPSMAVTLSVPGEKKAAALAASLNS